MNPRENVAGMAVAAVVLVAVLLAVNDAYMSSTGPGSVTTTVPDSFTVDGMTWVFNYTATTPAERAAGLMNKEVTDATTMLFAFPGYGRWSFWMYDTNTSLDMIWLNVTGGTGRVVYVVAGAQPCFLLADQCPTYTPTSAANFVIEAKAGFATANGIKVGTKVQFGSLPPPLLALLKTV
ncbi:MAG: DUF192 domain-containing protein [Nitrososphaerota archaeon]|jgi:uncharacterized membrane protein (UPF0127 family)|nr:DUF192 domain-containing protein [Nitrososphaerota archaeon]MDG6974322.1 DUF192 domain-containing protein [Nitrososphaerota archaeon]